MIQSILGFVSAILGVIVIVMMLLRLPDFPRDGRASVVAAALGLFVIARYLPLVVAPLDDLFAIGVAIYLTIFAFQQFKRYPRRTM